MKQHGRRLGHHDAARDPEVRCQCRQQGGDEAHPAAGDVPAQQADEEDDERSEHGLGQSRDARDAAVKTHDQVHRSEQ